jgi:hydroxymethylbilane synthase
MMKKVIIATRGSKLAMWQAEWVKGQLIKRSPELKVELLKIKTTGDKILDVPLAKIGGKGLFVKEIEDALLRGDADLAVHSMKDVPVILPEGLHISVICEREDPRDAFITQISNLKSQISNFMDLPHGATVGTSSLRRSCQILAKRPDLKVRQLRGNLDTRIRKLDEGQFDAIIVASAGIKRLGMEDRITELLSTGISLPAIGQGAIGIECRKDDDFINNLLKDLNHTETSICVKAERAFLRRLEGGCQVPIAAYARIEQKSRRSEDQKDITSELPSFQTSALIINGLVGSISGDTIIRGSASGSMDEAESLGISLAEDLLSRGADKILAEVYGR